MRLYAIYDFTSGDFRPFDKLPHYEAQSPANALKMYLKMKGMSVQIKRSANISADFLVQNTGFPRVGFLYDLEQLPAQPAKTSA